MVMAQIALSLMLLFSAGLFFRGALEAGGLDPGFQSAGRPRHRDGFFVNQKRADRGEAAHVRRGATRATVARASGQPPSAACCPTAISPTPAASCRHAKRMPTDPKAPDPGAGALFTSDHARLLRRHRRAHFARTRFHPGGSGEQGRPARRHHRRRDGEEVFSGERRRSASTSATPQPPRDGSPNDIEIVGVVNSHRHDVQSDTPQSPPLRPARAKLQRQRLPARPPGHARSRAPSSAMIPTLRQALRALDPDLPILNMAPFTRLDGKKRRAFGLCGSARSFSASSAGSRCCSPRSAFTA